ncbi:MAG: hypothetical protein VX938_08570 [Myxococcota bacterium]|nr:hypothetical protein [Myxococcota bacterium]
MALKAILVTLPLLATPVEGAPVVDDVAPGDVPSGTVTLLWWEGDLRVGTSAESPVVPQGLPVTLAPGDTMHLGDNTRAWLLDSHRGLFNAEARGVYRYQEKGWQGTSPTQVLALPGGPVALRPLWELSSRSAPSPYADEEAVLLEPVETGVNTSSLFLRWAPPSRGQSVTVNLWLLEADGGLRLLETWRDLQGPEWHPWTELEAGRTYLWRVRSDGLSERLAWFYVLPAEVEARLAELTRLVHAATDDSSARQGMEASLMSGMGLFEEAEIRWRSLSLSRPDRPVARRSAARLSRRDLMGPGELAYPPLPFGLSRPPTASPSGRVAP